jgi:hypothetical protein
MVACNSWCRRASSRLADDGAADGHPLALATGELTRLALQQRRQLEDAGGIGDLALHFLLVDLGQIEGEGQILAHAHMRIEGIGLEHHGQVALGRRHFGDVATVQLQGAAADLFQAGDEAPQG